MNNNKKGFTLIELIAIIAIIGLILGITIPLVMESSRKMEQKLFNSKVSLIERAAEMYGQDHLKEYNEYENTKTITVDDLVSLGYLKADDELGNIINPLNKEYLNLWEITIKYENKALNAVLIIEDE